MKDENLISLKFAARYHSKKPHCKLVYLHLCLYPYVRVRHDVHSYDFRRSTIVRPYKLPYTYTYKSWRNP